jgi:hypothetical protein
MMKTDTVYYHKLTGGLPIVIVNGDSVYPINEGAFGVIRFEKSPLRILVFNKKSINLTESLVDSTLAMYIGNEKFPLNEKLALSHAMKETMCEEFSEANQMLKKLYLRTYPNENEK